VAYVAALEETVMRPLQEVKDRQTKIKLRIRDDLKAAEAVGFVLSLPASARIV
jgi:hypothetical protein